MTPAASQFFQYTFGPDEDVVIVRVVSKDDLCLIVSIQDIGVSKRFQKDRVVLALSMVLLLGFLFSEPIIPKLSVLNILPKTISGKNVLPFNTDMLPCSKIEFNVVDNNYVKYTHKIDENRK